MLTTTYDRYVELSVLFRDYSEQYYARAYALNVGAVKNNTAKMFEQECQHYYEMLNIIHTELEVLDTEHPEWRDQFDDEYPVPNSLEIILDNDYT